MAASARYRPAAGPGQAPVIDRDAESWPIPHQRPDRRLGASGSRVGFVAGCNA